MNAPSKTCIALLLTLVGATAASEPSPVTPKPQGISPSSAAAPAPPMPVKAPAAPNPTPAKIDVSKYVHPFDRVALIWGYAACSVRPWVVTVVELPSRAITLRTLASSSELPLYVPSPPGQACSRGPCPTIAIEITPPQSILEPSLYSGTTTMGGGDGKGIYARTSGTSCSEPPMLADGDLIDLAMRLVQGRNDAAAAVAARAPAR